MTQVKVIKNFAGNISGTDTYHLLLADPAQQIVAQCGKQGDANLLAYLWNKHMEAACPDEGCPHYGTTHAHTDGYTAEQVQAMNEARVDDLLRNSYNALQRANNASGVCCCGDNMEGHPLNEHTPTDSGIRYAANLMHDISKAVDLKG